MQEGLDDDWRISSRTFHPIWRQRHPAERSRAR
jgi:hypothetical protein